MHGVFANTIIPGQRASALSRHDQHPTFVGGSRLSLSARRDSERASRSSAVTAFADRGSARSTSSSVIPPIVLFSDKPLHHYRARRAAGANVAGPSGSQHLGRFAGLRRTALPAGELVEFMRTWRGSTGPVAAGHGAV